MELSLITVAFDPQRRAFPRAPLAAVKGEILNVVEHFFTFDGVPHLLLIVHHRAVEEAVRADAQRRRKAPPEDLSTEQTKVFERLRAWRKGRAAADGVPVYVVFSNREPTGIARAKPSSRAALATNAADGADATGSWIRRLSSGVDQTGVPCLVAGAVGSPNAPSLGNEAGTTGRGTSVWRPVLSRWSST